LNLFVFNGRFFFFFLVCFTLPCSYSAWDMHVPES
jgi:hypothetical protein